VNEITDQDIITGRGEENKDAILRYISLYRYILDGRKTFFWWQRETGSAKGIGGRLFMGID